MKKPSIDKICIVCRSKYRVYQSQNPNSLFCSSKCYWEHKKWSTPRNKWKSDIYTEETKRKMWDKNIWKQARNKWIKYTDNQKKNLITFAKGNAPRNKWKKWVMPEVWNKWKETSDETKQKQSIARLWKEPRNKWQKFTQITWDKHFAWKWWHKNIWRWTLEYKQWRLDVYERDNFTCQMPWCWERWWKIEAHHIKAQSKYPELRFDVNNGITLCKKHHSKTVKKEKEFESLFANIILCRSYSS